MKNSIINMRLLLLLMGVFGCLNVAISQSKETVVSGIIVSEDKQPIEGVTIYGPNIKHVTTNEQGEFEFKINLSSGVMFEKEGYEPLMMNGSEVAGEIVMHKAEFLMSAKDEVNLGFSTKKKKEIVGSVASVKPADFLTYDNTQWVRSAIEGRMLGVKGSANIRGIGDAMVVIDGIPGRNMDYLNMDEVDEITILKDANAVALYGTQARNGVIVITTKKGELYKNDAQVNINYSFKEPIALPQYLGAVEYMELYNVARTNDGELPLYESTLIEAYKNQNNPYKYPDVDLYSNDYLRSSTYALDVVTQFSGGNDKLLYYVNLGWNRDGTLEKLNADASKGNNRFNVRGNIDFKINSFIKSSIGVLSVINVNQVANQSVYSVGTSLKPNDYAPFIPASLVNTVDYPELESELAAANLYEGYLLTTSLASGLNAPVADMIAGGDKRYINQTSQFNNSIDFDLSGITDGLSAKTYLSFDFYDASTKSRKNEYKVYYPTWLENEIVGLDTYGIDKKDLTENVSTRDFVSRAGFYGQLNYIKDIGVNHHLDATLLGYANNTSVNGEIQDEKNAHAGMHLGYRYKQKLLVDFNGNYANSIKFKEGKKGAFSPTLGVAYVLSEEAFLSNSEVLNYLKIRGSAGMIHSDMGISDYFLYQTIYGQGATFGWDDGNRSNRVTQLSQVGNPDIGYEKRNDINLGFEALMLKSLWMEFNAFSSEIVDQVDVLVNQYPSFYSSFRPSSNFNEDKYSGFELGMNYSKSFGDFKANIGGNLLYTKSEKTKRDEVYEFNYERRQGTSVEAYWGLMADGFYGVNDFDANGELREGIPSSSWTEVMPGDIRYVDNNNDGTIDSNDREVIGNWTNPFSYGLTLNLSYKSFNLFVLGTGQTGGEGNLSNNYYRVDGSDKYSEIVRGHWTPETADIASYPRLSSKKDNHNFQNSSFWLYDNSYFKINRAQLTYEFNKKVCSKLGLKKLSMNVSATNLLHLSKSKDIRELNIGSTPQYRHFSAGLRTTF
ncbi:SusC/RagA family TonB-linked outer membrane protein [Carboxylicivirga marina]|uniref:SusC/RagA family TonB-linked outer membrane protein n=1 Tax=Carboxylicivirga marina TaxID=2800988 RepID=A0ABS1HQD8_9BACT|nr:SusC/RagA family TonB-linked outer membrane protein [Carboxylicivirga marina]MBK3519379.1 SusC/RagA family TonB-linked outer membrane protein [Carboxylicivirga marina]